MEHALRFNFGDRVVAGEYGAGVVVHTWPDFACYGVMLDKIKGPFGDGSYLFEDHELETEEI